MESLGVIAVGLALMAAGVVTSRFIAQHKPIIYIGTGIAIIGVLVTLAGCIWYAVAGFS